MQRTWLHSVLSPAICVCLLTILPFGKNISEIIGEACFVGATAVISREVEMYGKSDHLVLVEDDIQNICLTFTWPWKKYNWWKYTFFFFQENNQEFFF